MCETYFHDKHYADFIKDLEPTMKQHEDAGLWKRMTRKVVPNYQLDAPGVVFVYEVL